MRRRPAAGTTVGTPRPTRTNTPPTTRHTLVDPAQLDGGARFPFLAQLHLPHGIFRSMWRSDDGETVETAWQQWTDLNAPPWHEFGLTATPTDHTIWLHTPDGPSWPLPLPADT